MKAHTDLKLGGDLDQSEHDAICFVTAVDTQEMLSNIESSQVNDDEEQADQHREGVNEAAT